MRRMTPARAGHDVSRSRRPSVKLTIAAALACAALVGATPALARTPALGATGEAAFGGLSRRVYPSVGMRIWAVQLRIDTLDDRARAQALKALDHVRALETLRRAQDGELSARDDKLVEARLDRIVERFGLG